MASSNLEPSSDKAVFWRIVAQKLGGKLYIHQLKLNVDDTGAVVMGKLRKQYQTLKSQTPYHIWDRVLLFWNPVIETAILSTVLAPFPFNGIANSSQNSTSDLEAQKDTCQVFTARRTHDIELTAAFHNPSILSNTHDFVRDNTQSAYGGLDERLEKEALVIGLRLSWIGILFLLLSNIILCFGTGLVVGMLTRRVDLGVAVTSSVAAVVACVETFVFLVYK
jgi:hypothetical protein